VDDIMENEEEMAVGEGLLDSGVGGSSVFLLIGMLGVGGGVVKEAESAERGSAGARCGMRFGSEELALSLALRLENSSIEGAFFRGCGTEYAALFISSSRALGLASVIGIGLDPDKLGVGVCSEELMEGTIGGGSVGVGVGEEGVGVAVRSTGILKSGE
jgi:hypothetical protein